MKKILTIAIFFFFVFFIIFNSLDIMESIKLSFSICINNLFPSLIPFMLLSNILINYNFVNNISDIFNKIMTKIFHVNKNCAFAFIMSIMSGTPSNSKYLKDLYDNELIDIKDCQKCLSFCHFANPIFVLGTIGYTFLGDKKLGLIILISHYACSLLLGVIFRGKIDYNTKLRSNKNSNKQNFINILTKSIKSTIDTLFLILGIITTCLIISCILNKLFNLNDNLKPIYGLIEITQGLNYLSLSNISIYKKAIISSFLISFGGFCIHAQVFSILDNKKIRYLPYLLSRLLHGILASILTAIFIMIIY